MTGCKFRRIKPVLNSLLAPDNMEDEALASLHSSYKSQAERRGKKGGLGVNEVYNFGYQQSNGSNALPKDPKQPYIRFVKAGYKPTPPSNKKIFADSDDESPEPDVEAPTKAAKKLKAQRSAKKAKAKKKSKAKEAKTDISNGEKIDVAQGKKKNEKSNKAKREVAPAQNGAKNRKEKANGKRKRSPSAEGEASGKAVDSVKKQKKKASMERKNGIAQYKSSSVKVVRLNPGDNVLRAIKLLTAEDSSLLTMQGDFKVLKDEEGSKQKAVHVFSASKRNGSIDVVALTLNEKILRTTIGKGSKAGSNLQVFLAQPES